MTYQFEDVNYALRALASLLRNSPHHQSRAGLTKEKRHVHFQIEKPLAREILLPSRKANIAAQIAETAWVLAGRSDIEWLSHYLPRAKDFSDDGKTWRAGYGPRLRAWNILGTDDEHGAEDGVDQLACVINTIRHDPNTRRAVISLWDPAVDWQPGKDIACNNWLSFSKRDGVLDLDVAIRSNDLIWGWSGINQFEWSVLLEIVAAATDSKVGSIYYNVTSFHAYERHFKRLDLLAAERYEHRPESPRFEFQSGMDPIEELGDALDAFFAVEEMIRTGKTISGSLYAETQAEINEFPEPMFRSWLQVLAWWWTGDQKWIEPLKGTALHEACLVGMQPPARVITAPGGWCAPKEFAEDLVNPGGWGGTTSPVDIRETAASSAQRLIHDDRVEDVREALRGVGSTRVSETPEKDLPALEKALRTYREASPFAQSVLDLHREKHAAYGDSWMKRGELFSILPNIARKVDRLGGGETQDETSADTAIDLLVYLAKYGAWLEDQIGARPKSTADTYVPNQIILIQDSRILPEEKWETNAVESDHIEQDTDHRIDMIRDRFDRLLKHTEDSRGLYEDRLKMVEEMLPQAYILAKRFWVKEQAVANAQEKDEDVDLFN